MIDIGPVKTEIVRGSSIRVLDRVLTPVARLTMLRKHRGTIRRASIEGQGWGGAVVQPLAVVEESERGERVLPIPDVTRTVLRQMAIVATVISIVALGLIMANRWARSR